uniref:Eukaryotic translation initiation factor 4E n=1 Tax=viral metagenome TaxID=1070528 RepID=A0A6C0JY22_9ZZZZ
MGSTIETTKLQYSWILWYHDPESKDYSLESYIKIADINTPQQFWTVVDSISKEAWESGMFFFMRRGFKPLWDSPENESGGAWSKKIEASTAHATFIDLMVYCITNELLTYRSETLVGITISPKGPFSIIKIWNTSTTVSDIKYIQTKVNGFKIGEDVTYTPHKSRPK